MKQGFTLIELLIATALASIISALLVTMYQNMNQMRTRVDQTINLHERVARLYAQLERDISGVFVPVEADMKLAGVAEGAPAVSTAAQAPGKTDQKGEQKPEAQGTTQAGALQGPKKLEKSFWGDHTLSELTFVTNNIMQRYWSTKLAQQIKPQARMARVMYKLEPDRKHRDSFVLMRQESPSLYLSDLTEKGTRAYQIADHIRAVRMHYGVHVKIPAEKKQASNATSDQATEQRKVVQEWKKVEDNKPPWPLVPEWVTMEIEFWDDRYQRTYSYTFEFYIRPRFEPRKPRQPSATVQLPGAQRPTTPRPASPRTVAGRASSQRQPIIAQSNGQKTTGAFTLISELFSDESLVEITRVTIPDKKVTS